MTIKKNIINLCLPYIAEGFCGAGRGGGRGGDFNEEKMLGMPLATVGPTIFGTVKVLGCNTFCTKHTLEHDSIWKCVVYLHPPILDNGATEQQNQCSNISNSM